MTCNDQQQETINNEKFMTRNFVCKTNYSIWKSRKQILSNKPIINSLRKRISKMFKHKSEKLQ